MLKLKEANPLKEDFEHAKTRRLQVPEADAIERAYKLNDHLFKYIFGRKQCKNILKAFLNSIFDESRQIEDLYYIDRERSTSNEQKGARFDVCATGKDGKIFHVEVQTTPDSYFFQRCVYYSSSSYSEQLYKGKAYSALCPVYLISLMDFICFNDGRDEYSHYRFVEEISGKPGPDTIELYMFELPKFKNSERKLSRALDKWLTYLSSTKKGSDPEMQQLAASEPAIAEAIEMEEAYFADRRRRRSYIIAELDRISAEEQRKLIEKELREAREAAKTADRAAKTAKEEGKIEMALNLLKSGVDVNVVAQAAGLPVENIKELLKA